jgi:hypothetical protein
MLGAFKDFASFLERRFLLNAFFPSMVFLGGLLLVFLAPHGGIPRAAKAWTGQSVTLQVVSIAAFLAGVWLFAGGVASQWRSIIRVFEGYWPIYLQRLLRPGQEWHVQRMKRLYEVEGGYARIHDSYPLEPDYDKVMPTRLGNILKSAELYPKYRYHADSVLLWPRLHHLFPENFRRDVADARAQLEFLLVISLLSTIFSIVAGGYLLLRGAAWWAFLLCFWGGILVAFGAYLGSTSNAQVYAYQLRVGFDLYRTELIRQLRLELPGTFDQERERWKEIISLFFYATPPEWTYVEDEEHRTLPTADAVAPLQDHDAGEKEA